MTPLLSPIPRNMPLWNLPPVSPTSVLGAFIYAYVVARPDIGYAVTTLARFSDHPAKVHYDAFAAWPVTSV